MNTVDPSTLNGLDWPIIRDHLVQRCATLRGQSQAALDDFASDPQEVLERYKTIREVWKAEELGDEVPVGGIHDIEENVERAAKGEVLEIFELIEIGNSIRAMHRLQTWVQDRAEDCPCLVQLTTPIKIDSVLLSTLRSSFTPNGELSDVMYPELWELRDRSEQLRNQVRRTLDKMLADPLLADVFQDHYITERAGRFVLPVRTQARKSLGIVHDMSQSGETAFVEPSVVIEPQNELKKVQAELRRTIARIIAELSAEVGGEHESIVTALNCATQVDLAQARAALGLDLDGVIPSVGQQGTLHVQRARHPILALRNVDVIPNDLSIDSERSGIVLTGPNAGGKTVTLKTAGLLALMVRAGLPVPAKDGAHIDWFDPIVALVGDQQDVGDDLSTFSAHLVGLRTALRSVGHNALVLLDELGVGTDPAQGAAIAQAVLESLVQNNARAVCTTHYTALKELAASHPKMALMGAVFADGRPTFRLEPDRVGHSHALAVARRMELPETVIQRARELLDTETRRMDDLVTQLENEREVVREQTIELDERQRKLDHETHRLHQRESKLNARRDREDAAVRAQYRQELRDHENTVKLRMKELQQHGGLREAHVLLDEIKEAREQTRVQPSKVPNPKPIQVNAGDAVTLLRMGGTGTVIATKGAKVQVDVRGKSLWIALDELGPGTTQKKKQGGVRFQTTSSDPIGVRTGSNTLDLRGLRVDEALDAVSIFLDKMLLTNQGTAFLLHGHGTGAIKTSLRQWLPKSAYGTSWHPGEPEEGGDAFTVVVL
jgi:DNA mismatch repair protein MutS2